MNFSLEEFNNLTSSGFITLNYSVIDSMGKESFFEIIVLVIEDGFVITDSSKKQVRFIDEKNYNKNAELYNQEDLTPEEIKESSENGGLVIDSLWYTNEDYKKIIQDTFKCINNHSPALNIYSFKKNDIEQIKDSLSTAVINGPTAIENQISNFIDIWF